MCQVKNTITHVFHKDKKEFVADLKAIYHGVDEIKGYKNRERTRDKLSEKYPNAMKSRETNSDVISPIFKFSTDIKKQYTQQIR